jgi:hypothetical protein
MPKNNRSITKLVCLRNKPALEKWALAVYRPGN